MARVQQRNSPGKERSPFARNGYILLEITIAFEFFVPRPRVSTDDWDSLLNLN